MSEQATPDFDVLLRHGASLRQMALALVSDAATAEDLAQETWTVAIKSPPRIAGSALAWLRRVFANQMHDSRRVRLRREKREQLVAEDTKKIGVTTPEELVARMELYRRLSTHLASLDEPIRQVLFLRYVEDLEPIEIARRLKIPDGTVRWRIKRGLDELRARFDDDAGGDRRAWMALFMPLIPKGNSSWKWKATPLTTKLAMLGSAIAMLAIFATSRLLSTKNSSVGLASTSALIFPAN